MLVAQQFICPHCEGEGKDNTKVSDCCGKKQEKPTDIFCPECEAVCDFIICPECKGEGVIERDVEIESA